jgi:predicted MFS family arabinose efflux permease
MVFMLKTDGKGFVSPITILGITVLIDMIGFGMIIPLLPFFARQLNSGPTGIGVLISSFSIMQFVFSPILGRLSDRTGRRPLLIMSILTSIGSFALFTIANNFLMLLLSRIIAGLATEGSVAQAYVADITTNEERSKGLGLVGAAFGIGFIIGPAIGGFLSPLGFWAPGLLAVVLGVVNLVFVFFFLPEPELVGGPSFVADSEEGFLRKMLDALRRPLTGSVLIIYFVVTFAFSALPVTIPLLAIEFFGFTGVEMSYVFMLIGIIQVLSQGFLMGRLTRTLGDEKLIIIGPLCMLSGVFLMPLAAELILFLASIALISLGVGITNTVVPSFISQKTPPDEQGGTLGLTQSVSSIARVPGPFLGGIILELGGLSTPFFVSAALLIAPFILGCRVFQACRLEGLI